MSAELQEAIELAYNPRMQFEEFHRRDERWAALVCHRRAGKTVACVNEVHERALYTQKKNARYSYIAPYYRQAKDVAWEYLKEATRDTAIKVRESQLRVELFNHAWITLYGADNPDAMRGIYNDGVILDEYGDCRPSLWGEVILPTLADRKGWAVFIGTPKGKNHFYDIWKRSQEEDGWFSMMLKASESGILDEEELRELRAQMSEEQYRQELECDFTAAVLGTYYAAIISRLEERGQVCEVSWQSEFPVHAVADIGYRDSTAWWFWQERPDGLAIIDYFEGHTQPLEYYFQMLDSKPYEYGTIWLPHDAKAKSLQTGRSTVEQFLEKKYPVRIAPKLSVQHGIDAVRKMLPKCYFDKRRTQDGLEGLRSYHRAYNEVKKVFGDKPQHDWASNPADGFRYLALVCTEKSVIDIPLTREQRHEEMCKPVRYTLNQLFEDHEKLNLTRRSMRI